MTAQDQYRSAAAFRAALEQRLRTEARTTRLPIDRLRKEAAFNRLLARLRVVAPDTWALKGGLAMIARLGEQIRATKDADVNWRAHREELEGILLAVEDLDLRDWFRFAIADPRNLQGEGEAGALRYPVAARLDGRLFEQLSLDINVIGPLDPSPVEVVIGRRNPFAFIDEPPLRIPMVTPAQQLAEKLHAYTRMYEEESSSRTKDLFDMLVIADQVQLPRAGELMAAAKVTFEVRATAWPPDLAELPTDWAAHGAPSLPTTRSVGSTSPQRSPRSNSSGDPSSPNRPPRTLSGKLPVGMDLIRQRLDPDLGSDSRGVDAVP